MNKKIFFILILCMNGLMASNKENRFLKIVGDALISFKDLSDKIGEEVVYPFIGAAAGFGVMCMVDKLPAKPLIGAAAGALVGYVYHRRAQDRIIAVGKHQLNWSDVQSKLAKLDADAAATLKKVLGIQ